MAAQGNPSGFGELIVQQTLHYRKTSRRLSLVLGRSRFLLDVVRANNRLDISSNIAHTARVRNARMLLEQRNNFAAHGDFGDDRHRGQLSTTLKSVARVGWHVMAFVLLFLASSTVFGIGIDASLYAAYKYLTTIVAIALGVVLVVYLGKLWSMRAADNRFRYSLPISIVAILAEICLLSYLALQKVFYHYG